MQINDDAAGTTADKAVSGSSTLPTSARVSTAGGASGSSQNVRKITTVTPFVEDLTSLEENTVAWRVFCKLVSMIRQVDSFDMTATDDDDCSTFAPDVHEVQHVRAVNDFRSGEKVEILPDSGADSSVLPLSCGHMGHSMAIDHKVKSFC